MINKKYTALYLFLAVIPLIYVAMVFGGAPEIVPTHFNVEGIADGFGSKWTLWILPVVVVVIAIVAMYTPFLTKFAKQKDDKSLNVVAKFNLIVLIMLDLVSISIVYTTLNYSEGKPSEIGLYMLYILNIFFIISGFALPKISRNSVIGIRIPFTLMDSEVWTKTHKIGGKLWIVAGVVGLVITFVTKGNVWFGILPILIACVLTFIYSAILFYSKK